MFRLISAKNGSLVISRQWDDERGKHIMKANYHAQTLRVDLWTNGEHVQAATYRNTNEAQLWKQVQLASR